MNKILFGLFLGILAGIIDIIPMLIQKLPWDANFSAFAMWIVVGFFVSVVEIKIPSVLKGILLSVLALLPSAILICWEEPKSLVPILIMTTLLGGLLGYTFNKFAIRIKKWDFS